MPPSHRGDLTVVPASGTEFDLHGIVGIRLVDAGPSDVAKVRRQLGPLDRPLEREPDIVVRFTDRVVQGALTHVGLNETGYDANGFYVRNGQGWARLPLERIGRQPEVVCEHGVSAVPHLLALINLTALAKGVLPLHASAYDADGLGVLITGWSKGGKTEALLGAMARGARYVGDEWVYLGSERSMSGIPEPIRLWAWQLDQLDELRAARSRATRARLVAWRRASILAERAATAGVPGARTAAKAAPVLARQAYVQVPPVELFGSAAIALRGRLDAVVLVESHTGEGSATESVSAELVADRMLASLRIERTPLLTHYEHFRYAFPDLSSTVVDAADANERRLLRQVFSGLPASRVSHPYPCDIADLGIRVEEAARASVRTGPRRVKDLKELSR